MVATSLIVASESIGFISFAFTLLTWLGVYLDLVQTLRSAPSQIPIALGNLREEILYEQAYVRCRLQEGDDFHVFSDLSRELRKRRQEFASLMDNTLRHIWREFCDIEKSFINQTSGSSDDDTADQGNGKYEMDEKAATSEGERNGRIGSRLRRRETYVKSRMGFIEAGLSRDRRRYYNCDLAHRFKWWWRKGDVNNLATQVQRIQIRRIERDVYVQDHITKRTLRVLGRLAREDVMYSETDEDDEYSEQEPGSGTDEGRGGPNRDHVRRHSSQARSKRRSTTAGNRKKGRHSGNFRETSEKEIVRKRNRSTQNGPRAPSEAHFGQGKNGRQSRGSMFYEYEVVNPGRIYVDVDDERPDQIRRDQRDRSYSRERSRNRNGEAR